MSYQLKDNSKVINASEIGEYRFCSVSWYLRRCGFKPESKALKKGEEKHIQLGDTIDKVERQNNLSHLVSYVGYFLLFLGFVFIIFEVFL